MAAEGKNARPSGHFERIDEVVTKHADEIKAVRALLEREEADDVVVYRFLRGYKFNVEAAAAALGRMHEWREENGLDEVREAAKGMSQAEFPHAERFLKAHPHNISHGTDRRGQPLSLERIGHSDPQLLTKLLTMEELMEYHLYHVEHKAHKVAELSRSTGTVMRTTKIIDVSGLGTRALHPGGLKYLRTLLRVSQAAYPEMLGNAYIINAPYAFQLIWKVVKPWLNPLTLEKIQILDSASYREVLRERIDPAVLPTWAGGDCECEGGCVVEVDPDHDMAELAVRARDHETVEFDVPEPQYVNFEFRTRSKDVLFGVSFLPRGADEADAVEVLKEGRRPSARGDFKAPGAGTLRLFFGNDFSYMTGKTVLYRVDEVPVPSSQPCSPRSADDGAGSS